MKTQPLLIIRFSSLGDILLTTSFVQALADRFPDHPIHYLTKSIYVPLLSHFPRPVTPIRLEDYSSLTRLASYLRSLHFQSVYDLHDNLRSHSLQILMRSSFHRYRKRHLYRSYKTWTHQQVCDLSTPQSYLTALPPSQRPAVPPPVNLLVPGDRSSQPAGSIQLGIHPGASFPTKQWPLNYLEQLIEQLLDTRQYQITLMGGTKETNYLNRIQSRFSSSITIQGPALCIDDLIRLIASQDLMLTNDSGPAHLTSALNIPQLCLFGATHPSLGFAPGNPKTRILTRSIACSPCSLHGSTTCPKHHFQCMLSLTPHDVFQHLLDLTSQYYPQFH